MVDACREKETTAHESTSIFWTASSLAIVLLDVGVFGPLVRSDLTGLDGVGMAWATWKELVFRGWLQLIGCKHTLDAVHNDFSLTLIIRIIAGIVARGRDR